MCREKCALRSLLGLQGRVWLPIDSVKGKCGLRHALLSIQGRVLHRLWPLLSMQRRVDWDIYWVCRGDSTECVGGVLINLRQLFAVPWELFTVQSWVWIETHVWHLGKSVNGDLCLIHVQAADVKVEFCKCFHPNLLIMFRWFQCLLYICSVYYGTDLLIIIYIQMVIGQITNNPSSQTYEMENSSFGSY